jgi:cell division septum initiation protein DivIVA
MTNRHESIPDLMQDDTFEVVMRGYNRRQVHDYMIRTRNQVRDLEERLARAIDQAEQGRIELAEARRQIAEVPQNFNPSTRLEQILKLGQEEALAMREEAEAETSALRESARSESERLMASARETADKILTSAQAEAERRVSEATQAAESMLAQAGSDAEEARNAARMEAETRVREAHAEAERLVSAATSEAERLVSTATSEAERMVAQARAESEQTLAGARDEAERTVTSAREEAESALAAAQQRVASLDEHAGRRVEYLTNTHSEVVRRLNEVSTVLSDLMRDESAAGALMPADLSQALTPAPQDDVRVIVEVQDEQARDEQTQDEQARDGQQVRDRQQVQGDGRPQEAPAEGRVSEDTDVNIGRLQLRQ